MSTSLSGKIVLVTGASAGIGRACAVAFVRAGAKVIASGRRQGELDKMASECGTGVETIAGDLDDLGFCADLAARASGVDILVSNAGVLKYAPLLEMTDADIDWMFRTNVLASFRITLALGRSMAERGRGHIIVMTSTAARDVYPLGVIYCATKHALSAFARGLRVELQGRGVKVTEIAPGMVDTGIRAASDHPAVLEALRVRKFTALTADEVAEAVIYAAQANPNLAPDFIELRPRGSG